MECKNCGRHYLYVSEDDGLCDDCFDYLNGHSSRNPAEPNVMLEKIQAMLEDDDEIEDEIEDDDMDRENW